MEMKTRYKILIIVLILIPVSVMMTLVVQALQYKITIDQFDENCQKLQEKHNQSNGPCMWPGGPPHKPILEIP